MGLNSPIEIEPALRAIQYWCDATGMRENAKKREGLAMGKYRYKRLRRDIKWCKDGDWIRYLGVPIGNDLDHEAWWKKKMAAVDEMARRWVGLFRASRAGRTLVVQAMYYGRFRYWLYSTPISVGAVRVNTHT